MPLFPTQHPQQENRGKYQEEDFWFNNNSKVAIHVLVPVKNLIQNQNKKYLNI